MKLFKNAFIATLAVVLALFLIGQAIIAYNQNRSTVNKAGQAVVKASKEAGKAVESSYKAVVDLVEKQ